MNALSQTKHVRTIESVKMSTADIATLETILIKDFHKYIGSDITIPIMTIF